MPETVPEQEQIVRPPWCPNLAPKGIDVLNDYHRFLLLTGPRLTSKTTNLCAKVCRHLWENDGAMFAILGKSMKSIKSSGTWQDLVVKETGMHQWLNAGIGFEYTVEPKLTGDTKMTFFRIRNMFGGESELQIHSLEHDHQVEEKFKNSSYSGFWMIEADNFRTPEVMLALDDQLRSETVPEDQLQILLDCNPPEEGDDHWLYKYFFLKCAENGKPFSEEYAGKFGLFEFFLEDNPFLPESRKRHLRDKYAHDELKRKRYVEGRWVKDTGGGLFSDVFIESQHVLGKALSPNEDEWEIIIPGPDTIELCAGWDTGDLNHGMVIASQRHTELHTVFELLDEVIIVGKKTSLNDYTEMVMERIDFWENLLKEFYGREGIRWRHWSDPTVMRYKSGSNTYDATLIHAASEGKIQLIPVIKTRGSVKKRISLVKKLMFDGRIVTSARCKQTIDMYRYIKSDGSVSGLDPHNPYKHAFDAVSYMLEAEAPAEMDRRANSTVVRTPRIISVGA